jgi:anti-anti-sigma factor
MQPTSETEDLLKISTGMHDGILIVTAEGDVDLSTTPILRQALETHCAAQTERGSVAVDMRDVAFIDSAGLALLVEMRKRFSDTCRLALIVEASSQPERVLRLGRFDTFLQVCHSPDELTSSVPA